MHPSIARFLRAARGFSPQNPNRAHNMSEQEQRQAALERQCAELREENHALTQRFQEMQARLEETTRHTYETTRRKSDELEALRCALA
jgi:DNA repair exonuclease SbcCD ATPase subunit